MKAVIENIVNVAAMLPCCRRSVEGPQHPAEVVAPNGCCRGAWAQRVASRLALNQWRCQAMTWSRTGRHACGAPLRGVQRRRGVLSRRLVQLIGVSSIILFLYNCSLPSDGDCLSKQSQNKPADTLKCRGISFYTVLQNETNDEVLWICHLGGSSILWYV